MADQAEAARVRTLGDGESWKASPGASEEFPGSLEKVQGTRLTIRTTSQTCPVPFGTLVEVETPRRLYLGEVKYFKDGLVFIDYDHELGKGDLEAIRLAWSPGSRSSAPKEHPR